MPIKTSRTSENARIIVDYNKCKACGLCTNVCEEMILTIKDANNLGTPYRINIPPRFP